MNRRFTEDLRKIILENIRGTGAFEDILVEDSLGRVLSEEVIPEVSVPSFERSAVDGFAIIGSDILEKGINVFNVVSRITAGYSGEMPALNSGETAFVTTGAPIPPGSDTVLLIEEVDEFSGGKIIYSKGVEKGAYVSQEGDDIQKNKTLFKKGHIIRLCDIAALSGIGRNYVSVYKKPVVGIISGGNELTEPGKKLDANKIYDINTTVLKSLVKDAGGIPSVIGVVKDEFESLCDIFSKADDPGKYDLIISTGGTGASFLVLENKEITNFYDLVPSAIEKTGRLLFHGVRLVPGKPTSFGILKRGTPVVALAGWPYSVLITFDLFVRPALQKIMNSEFIFNKYPSVSAVLKEDAVSEKGVRKFFQVKLSKEDGILYASLVPAPKPPSAARSLSPMVNASGSFVMDEDTTLINAGENVDVTLNYYKEEGK